MKILYKKFGWLAIFSIAMGLLEAIVVIYLREIYYPQGFSFPLNLNVSAKILNIEYLREIATIIMLVSIGILAGKNFVEKFCYFLYSFGLWDIFYYIFLKILLNWPESLFTWDLLFLIPVPWISPVLAPVILSCTMIFLSVSIILLREKYNIIIHAKFSNWLFALLGTFIIFISFILDFLKIIINGGFLTRFNLLTINSDFRRALSQYVPEKYNWWLLITGEILLILSFILQSRKRD